MDAPVDLTALRERLTDLELRRDEVSFKAAAVAAPGPAEQLEALRFELAEVAWRLNDLEDLAW